MAEAPQAAEPLPQVAVVIPCYNAGARIAPVVAAARGRAIAAVPSRPCRCGYASASRSAGSSSG